MEMNRNQLTMAVAGGVAGVITLALLAMVYVGAENVSETRDDVAGSRSVCESKRGITRKSGNEARANMKALADVAIAAYASLTNRGVVAETPDKDALQKTMYADAVKFRALPRNSAKKIIAEDFGFGVFAEYINGKVPAKRDVPKLFRRWGDVSAMTEILLDSGATELLAVKVLTKDESAETEAITRRQRGRRQTSQKTGSEKYPCSEELYEIEFLAKPAALVKVLNALAADKTRFYAVDAMSFDQPRDSLLQAIGGDGEKDKKGRAKGGRNKKAAEEKESEIGRSKMCLTDPSSVEPFRVVLNVSTIVFAAKEESK